MCMCVYGISDIGEREQPCACAIITQNITCGKKREPMYLHVHIWVVLFNTCHHHNHHHFSLVHRCMGGSEDPEMIRVSSSHYGNADGGKKKGIVPFPCVASGVDLSQKKRKKVKDCLCLAMCIYNSQLRVLYQVL